MDDFSFLKTYKWYQIAQSVLCMDNIKLSILRSFKWFDKARVLPLLWCGSNFLHQMFPFGIEFFATTMESAWTHSFHLFVSRIYEFINEHG